MSIEDLVVEISIDDRHFREALASAAAAIRELSHGIARRDPDTLAAIVATAERARQTAPQHSGAFGHSLVTDSSMSAWLPGRRAQYQVWDDPAQRGSLGPEDLERWRNQYEQRFYPVVVCRCRSYHERTGIYVEDCPCFDLQDLVDAFLPPAFGALEPPELVDDGQAHDYDPDRCWKCDAKPGVEELDGACWRCWYALTRP